MPDGLSAPLTPQSACLLHGERLYPPDLAGSAAPHSPIHPADTVGDQTPL